MTADKNYMHGFCKTAHSAGLDPALLLKQALNILPAASGVASAASGAAEAASKALKGTGSWIGDKFGRFVSLLLGSPRARGPVLHDAKDLMKELGSMKRTYARGKRQGLLRESSRKAWAKARADYWDAVRGGVSPNSTAFVRYRNAYDLARKMARGRARMRILGEEILKREADLAEQLKPIQSETRKVWGARALAAGGLTAGAGIYGNMQDDDAGER